MQAALHPFLMSALGLFLRISVVLLKLCCVLLPIILRRDRATEISPAFQSEEIYKPADLFTNKLFISNFLGKHSECGYKAGYAMLVHNILTYFAGCR